MEGGRYLLCDVCTLETFTLNLPWNQDSKLIREARTKGWLLTFDAGQRLVMTVCPKCHAIAKAKGELT